MLLDRRTFAGGTAALLSGCATVGTRTVLDVLKDNALCPLLSDEGPLKIGDF